MEENLELLPASIVSDNAAKVFESDKFNSNLIHYCAAKINEAANKGRFSCNVVLSSAVELSEENSIRVSKVIGNLADYLTYAGYRINVADSRTRTLNISWVNPKIYFGD